MRQVPSTPALSHVRPSARLAAALLLCAAGCASDASEAREVLARGRQLAAAHELDAAATQLASASSLDPTLHEAFARLARVRLEQRRAPDAETAALRAASLVPRSAYYVELLGRAQLASGKLDGAVASLDQAITLDPTQTARLAFVIGLLRERAREPSQALAAYERAAAADTNAALPRIALVRLLLDGQRLEDAKRRLEEARPHVAPAGDERAAFAALDARLAPLYAGHQARARQRSMGITGVVGAETGMYPLLGSSSDGAAGHFVDADAFGDGDAIGDSFGRTGLGVTGMGESGGYGDRSIGRGSLGTVGGRRLPDISPGTPTVAGTLPADAIRRIVRRHINELRFCYETALARNPDLAGRVLLTFTIAPTGVAAQTSATGLGDADAETCMATAVQRWLFPAPEGGAPVRVSYPLALAPHAAVPR